MQWLKAQENILDSMYGGYLHVHSNVIHTDDLILSCMIHTTACMRGMLSSCFMPFDEMQVLGR